MAAAGPADLKPGSLAAPVADAPTTQRTVRYDDAEYGARCALEVGWVRRRKDRVGSAFMGRYRQAGVHDSLSVSGGPLSSCVHSSESWARSAPRQTETRRPR